jgi:signal transduction histidine kinase
MDGRMSETAWRPWLPEGIAAFAVLTAGFFDAYLTWAFTRGGPDGFALVLAVALAVALCRKAPGAALVIVWGLGMFHVFVGAPIMLTEFALTAVFFGGARWGRPATMVMSAVSVPLAVIVAFALHEGAIGLFHLLGGSMLGDVLNYQPTVRLVLALVALLVVAGPWPAGLVLRFLERASTSRSEMLAAEQAAVGAWRETEHAREIAHLRDQQTRLARDVHDIVGHSLAVILAQAESGQYLEDTTKLKKTLQTIATSARSSLRDVRQVLSSTQDNSPIAWDTARFDALLDGVRGSGHEIISTEVGTPRQMTRETAAVAYRVLQEMLTNAIRHGRRDHPIVAERHWPTAEPAGGFADTLRIEVSNMTDAPKTAARGGAPETAARDAPNVVARDAPDTAARGAPDIAARGAPNVVAQGAPNVVAQGGTGRGLDGMRRRLESVGGHLDVRRREQEAGTTFTVTAFVPVQGGGTR